MGSRFLALARKKEMSLFHERPPMTCFLSDLPVELPTTGEAYRLLERITNVNNAFISLSQKT